MTDWELIIAAILLVVAILLRIVDEGSDTHDEYMD